MIKNSLILQHYYIGDMDMSFNVYNNVKIMGLSFIVPDNIKYCVDDYPQFFDNNPKKLARAKKIMGYGTTYHVPEGVTPVDLLEIAANDVINSLDIDINTIDGLVFVSQAPDYITPPSSNILHSRLGLSEECALFDLKQGCTGFVYGLWTASSLVESKACKRVLLLCSDVSIDVDSLQDKVVESKSASLIFSSGACALLLEYNSNNNVSPMYFHLGSRGSGYEQIITPSGGSRLYIDKDIFDIRVEDKDGNPWSLTSGFMDGLGVFNFSIEVVPGHIKKLLKYSGHSISDIDFFAIHQANKQIVDNVAMLAGIPDDKYSTETFSKYGNMSGVSSANNLVDVLGQELNDKTFKVAVVSFGIGLSWASVVMDIGNIYCSGIKFHTFKNIPTRQDTINYWINKFKNYSGS